MFNIKEYVENKKIEIKNMVETLDAKPKLVIIQVGAVEASSRYVRNKMKDCETCGIPCDLIHLEENITEQNLLELIDQLNNDDSVTGFIVQLPLPKHIREQAVIEAINPKKDVDGFSKLALVNPGTPQGIITYLEDNNYDFTNKNAVVIGRSNIVGRPIAKLLLDRSCNVSVIHSKTSAENKVNILHKADLIIVATGHRNTLTNADLAYTDVKLGEGIEAYEEGVCDDWIVNPKCFIVDVGININEEGKLCGDCENVTVCEKTPVPGGVGLLTRLALITNLIKLYKMTK